MPLRSFKSAAGAARTLSHPPWVQTAAAEPSHSRQQELSGCDWGFKVFDNPQAVPEGFWQPDFDAAGFGKVSYTFETALGTARVVDRHQR